jgi:hypothetical protein
LFENISNNIKKEKENPNIIKYDSLTNEYLSFLSVIEKQINAETSQIFFEDEKYSKKGEEFISKTKKYKSEIEKLFKSKNLKKRLNLVLNTNDMRHTKKNLAENNENNEILVNKTYIKYLDYYFRSYPKIQSLALLNSKKRSILELENEFIENEIP